MLISLAKVLGSALCVIVVPVSGADAGFFKERVMC